MRALVVVAEARAERRAQALVDEVDARGLRVARGVAHGALLKTRRGAGHAYDDVAAPVAAAVDARDECLEHLLDGVEVLYRPAAHGAENVHVLRLAAEHLVRLAAHLEDFARVLVYGDRRGLVQDNAAVWREYERVDRSEVYSKVVRKDAAKDIHSSPTCPDRFPDRNVRRGQLKAGNPRSTSGRANFSRSSAKRPRAPVP